MTNSALVNEKQITQHTFADAPNVNVISAEKITLGVRSTGTLWLTGLSGAGKSTIAQLLLLELLRDRISACVLDGDDLRCGLNADLGFSDRDRAENVRRMGEVAVLFARAGVTAIVSAISPYASDRQLVRHRHRELNIPFREIYVATPLSVCESRDPKGLYAKARRGEIAAFTGVSHPYEAPEQPDLIVHTFESPRKAVMEVLASLRSATPLQAELH